MTDKGDGVFENENENRKGRDPEDIDGREYSSRRGPGFAMTVTEPPVDWRWTHANGDIGEEDGDGTVSNAVEELRLEMIRIQTEREATTLNAARMQRWKEDAE